MTVIGPDHPEHPVQDTITKALGMPTYAERLAMLEAHDEGMHDEVPREFCPECERKRGRVGP